MREKASPEGDVFLIDIFPLLFHNAHRKMLNGEIIEWGTHEQLLAMKGRYYELYTGKAELD